LHLLSSYHSHHQEIFNPPPDDIFQFSFVLFLPNFSSDVTLVDGSEYDVTSCPFIFPDHKFCIDSYHQHGIFKMIWQASSHTVLCLILLAFIIRLQIILVIFLFYFFLSLGKLADIRISLFYSKKFSWVV
ncbi:hypothetical protein VP01_1126g2, partial [Puccinia sorghi]